LGNNISGWRNHEAEFEHQQALGNPDHVFKASLEEKMGEMGIISFCIFLIGNWGKCFIKTILI
jgi:hypothetical protein